MKDGFIRVAAASPSVKVADIKHNSEKIKGAIKAASDAEAAVVLFPELSLTGCTCGDLFYSDVLIHGAETALGEIVSESSGLDMIIVLGLPIKADGLLYNAAAVIYRGRILGIVPKNVKNDRHFAVPDHEGDVSLLGEQIPFATASVFECSNIPDFAFSVCFADELNRPFSASDTAAVSGATLLLCPKASPVTVISEKEAAAVAEAASQRLVCGIVTADAAAGESSTDYAYGGQRLVCELGRTIESGKAFSDSELTVTEIDIGRISSERIRSGDFKGSGFSGRIEFEMPLRDITLTRKIAANPFVPDDGEKRASRIETALEIQVAGLSKRMAHIGAKRMVVAVSGGLDSTLALICAVKTADKLGLLHSAVTAISMPGFGTTSRTKSNAAIICGELGVEYKEIPIADAVRVHFRDIGQDENVRDVAYENSQARERTQIAMDYANRIGGILIGTGDLSELALGWATYNGDHMSMYGVNAGIPKTLIRAAVTYLGDKFGGRLGDALHDIVATPVSPELLPADEGKITQVTEDIVGPYELHDFFIYYFIRYSMTPEKIFRLAVAAFDGVYSKETICRWLDNFVRRFFSSQFKRSCVPDGPAVGSVGFSPRGAWEMPSDACRAVFEASVKNIADSI